MDKTQFIIITHSRKTMEIANRLYGVTMEEPGVSKLISIQLQEKAPLSIPGTTSSNPTPSKPRLVGLDLLRLLAIVLGLAAACLRARNPGRRALSSCSLLGASAVGWELISSFVLSGFLVSALLFGQEQVTWQPWGRPLLPETRVEDLPAVHCPASRRQ